MNCGSPSAKDWPCKACKIQACQGCIVGTSGFGHVLNDKRECEKVANTVFPHSILQRLYSPLSMLARTGSTKSNTCRFKKIYTHIIKIILMLCLVKLIETMYLPLSYFNFLELLSPLLINPVLSDRQIKKKRRFLFLFFIFRKHVMQVSTFHPQLWEFQTVWADRGKKVTASWLTVCETVIWSQHLKNIVILSS